MYKSLADFIERLESADELIRIGTPVSSEEEIAEITDRMVKSEGGGKALLFEKSDRDFPVVTNLMGSERRIALALGVESVDDITKRIDGLVKQVLSPKSSLGDKLKMLPLLGEVAKWFPRTTSGRGECQQVVLVGEEASLERLPILKSWGNDGGRFVTLPMVNTIDPDTGVRNVGMYRMQVFDAHTTGMHWHRHKTGARHYEGYKARGERMPVSVALGGDPVYTYCATAPMPDNMDEYLLAGLLRQKPVKLVKCITNDIYVPADCDFVIEGYVDTAEPLTIEGDFGDHTGFFSLTDLYPKFHVTAITHRRDAIYPATIVGIPPQEDAYLSLASERIFLAPIRLVMQPEVEDFSMPVAGTSHNIVAASIHTRYMGQATKVAQGLWGAGQMMFNKYMVLAPSGTDVHNPSLLASLARRCNPAKAIIRSEGIYDVLDHATATCGYGGKMAFDMTSIEAKDYIEPSVPSSPTLPAGVSSREDLVEAWSVWLLFAAPEAEVDMMRIAAENGVQCNCIALFDARAEQMNAEELLWLAAANTDPARDVCVEGRMMVVDARPKQPGREGNPRRFPNVVTSRPEIIATVDRRWEEYGIGEFIPSPSLRYRQLLLSEGAEW
ncbi:MAG: menaquinone biosynthesis decarboxylase [Alistipes sp.]|nr:menaquinone biosynthesis decarboxylase [Alistipes sp.]